MRLTLGPVLFNWPTPMWTDFYARIADEAPVDRVVIGEVVCSKRSLWCARCSSSASSLAMSGKNSLSFRCRATNTKSGTARRPSV